VREGDTGGLKIDALHYRDGYKAVVAKEQWRCESPIRPDEDIHGRFYSIMIDGTIIAEIGYAWDFATGAFNTDTIKRASLAHDIPCQAIAEGKLDPKWQPVADKLLKGICLRDGMWKVRAWWVYRAVRAYQKRKKRILFEAHPIKCIPAERSEPVTKGCA